MSRLWSRLESDDYRNRQPLPLRPVRPVLRPDAGPAEFRAHADLLESYDERMTVYRDELAAYNAASVALEAEFRQDLEQEHGMTDHPRADLLYGKSWARGHSGGLVEIANVYSDLVELVQ